MAQVINTNVQSLNAQRNLNTSQAAQNSAIQRLSSGLRINSAKDDAAGLAISERMSSQIRGMNVAQRNAQDGISLAQTAEGGLGKVGDNLQRIRELAVQASNATNSDSDRAALNTEAQQLMKEIDRVAKSTSFNGVSLLDGSFEAQSFQVGAGAGESIAVNKITDAQVAKLGSTYTKDSAAMKDLDNSTGTVALTIDFSKITVTDTDGNAVKLAGSVSVEAGQKMGKAEVAAAFAEAINGVSGRTGVQAIIDSSTAKITYSSVGSEGKGFEVADGGALAAAGTAAAKADAVTDKKAGFEALDLSKQGGARKAIDMMDAALAQVNSSRASLGAVQNRFESVVSTLQTNSENLSSSKSRIMDTDFAAETANLTRAQILQQAGTAMLAQANQLPQNVLNLLR